MFLFFLMIATALVNGWELVHFVFVEFANIPRSLVVTRMYPQRKGLNDAAKRLLPLIFVAQILSRYYRLEQYVYKIATALLQNTVNHNFICNRFYWSTIYILGYFHFFAKTQLSGQRSDLVFANPMTIWARRIVCCLFYDDVSFSRCVLEWLLFWITVFHW